MHVKIFKEENIIWRYMEALALHPGATTVHWEDSTSCISVVEAKEVIPIVKNIDIHVCFY